MRKITFDIETSNFFDDVGSSNPADLDLAVVCIHDSKTDEYSSYEKETLNQLWPIIEASDMLIGYNSDHFDVPLLNKYYAGDLTQIKSLDILAEIKKSFGRRVKLDSVVQATLGQNKSADGLQAVVWWRKGEKQKVIDYCIQDVKVTKNIYDYAIKHQLLKVYDDRAKKVEEIKLDTSLWEEKDGGLIPTLGF